jgi:hypothetical protein
MIQHVARGVIQYSLCQRGIHSCRSDPKLHLVSDAMIGAIFAVVCEVLSVTHYQRLRMVESIDRVRLFTSSRISMMVIACSIEKSIYAQLSFQ